jgi:flagellar export protein FliJ
VRRFQFGLERVLKVKHQREKIAEARLAQARVALEAAQDRVAELGREIVLAGEALNRLVGRVLTAEVWAQTFDHSARLGAALETAEGLAARAQRVFDEAAEARKAIATEVEALKTLKQQKWEVYKDEVQRAEQIRLDEISMRGWQGDPPG